MHCQVCIGLGGGEPLTDYCLDIWIHAEMHRSQMMDDTDYDCVRWLKLCFPGMYPEPQPIFRAFDNLSDYLPDPKVEDE